MKQTPRTGAQTGAFHQNNSFGVQHGSQNKPAALPDVIAMCVRPGRRRVDRGPEYSGGCEGLTLRPGAGPFRSIFQLKVFRYWYLTGTRSLQKWKIVED